MREGERGQEREGEGEDGGRGEREGEGCGKRGGRERREEEEGELVLKQFTNFHPYVYLQQLSSL